jgi:glycosyltransferase involved in cell wall biosynthesis
MLADWFGAAIPMSTENAFNLIDSMESNLADRPARKYERAAEAQRLRVLVVAPSLDILGGQSIQAARLIQGLNQDSTMDAGFLPHNPRLPGIFRTLQSIKYLRTALTTVAYLASLLSKVRHYDVIHVFSASYYSYLLSAMPAILVARLYGKPSILNYRSGEAEDHLAKWRMTAVPTMRMADRIIVPSGYLVDVFKRFGLKADAIFNTVNSEAFCYRERRPLRPVFLSGRNLEPLYNVACILRAFSIIQKRFPEARLIVAGEGSQRKYLERLAADLRLNNIEFVGPVPPERMGNLYNSADIYLNSSDIDNMPGSILESFASGLPVVTTEAGGIPYIVRHGATGLMVRCGDHEGLARWAIRLLEEKGLAERIISNALGECDRYRWEAARAQWIKLYADLAEGCWRSDGTDELSERGGAPGDTKVFSSRTASPNPAPLRVLIVAPSLNILGGQSIQATYLRSMLQEIPDLAVGHLPINPQLPGPLHLLQEIKYVRTAVTSMAYCYNLIRCLHKYDIAHIFSASYFSFLLSPTPAMLAARMYGKTVVLNYHSGEAEDHMRTWRRTAVKTMRLADRIVVPSAYLVEVFGKFELPAVAVFNTVDGNMFRFRRRSPLRPMFLSNRNLEPLYNVACILKAFSIIQKIFADARLTVAGDGSQRHSLEQLAIDLGLRNIDFVGRVSPERMSKLYDAADIYLNSSDIDNMPGSILESFASGLPVVTTGAGGIPYIVKHGETGLMVKCGDHEGLAAGAIRLLEESELAEKVITNARLECEKYRWSAVRNQWADFYGDLVRRPFEDRYITPDKDRGVTAPSNHEGDLAMVLCDGRRSIRQEHGE